MDSQHPHEGRAGGKGPSHKQQQAQHHGVAQERGAPGRRTEGGNTTHHGTTAHIAPPRSHQDTNTARAPHRPHAPKPRRPPQGQAAHPNPHIRADSTWAADTYSLPRGRPAGGGGERMNPDAPHNGARHPPPGTPSRHPHRAQRRLAEAHAVEPVLGLHTHTNRAQETRVAEPWPPAPRDGRPGEGQRLTPDTPHIAGRPPPPGTGSHHPTPATRRPSQGMQAKGTVQCPHARTPASTARG